MYHLYLPGFRLYYGTLTIQLEADLKKSRFCNYLAHTGFSYSSTDFIDRKPKILQDAFNSCKEDKDISDQGKLYPKWSVVTAFSLSINFFHHHHDHHNLGLTNHNNFIINHHGTIMINL